MRLAYPYLRYSTPEQAKGDSTRRQRTWAEDTCAKEGWQIDTSFPLEDKGKSAYKGDHLKADLGRFLQAVATGRIPRGSVLLFEELDRLSRQRTGQAMPLFIGILTAGVDIRTREKHYTAASLDDPGSFIGAYLKLTTANDESAKKSVRISAVWQSWRDDIGAGNRRPPPGRMPPWVRWDGEAFALVPRAAEAVRLIYRLAGEGLGLRRVLDRLNGDAVPTIGRCDSWRLSYVAKLLTTREVMGEFTDTTGTVHAGMYPAAVTPDEFYRARAAVAGRKIGNKGVGRTGASVPNLFVGLLYDARDGSALHVIDKGVKGVGKQLVSSAGLSRQRGAKRETFPYAAFEEGVLKRLREVKPAEVLGQPVGVDEVRILSGELANVESRIAAVEAELAVGDLTALAKLLRQLEEQRTDIANRLAEARHAAAHPLSESWGEAQSLLETLNAATDLSEARLRLRAALRRVVKSVHCLFVKRGQSRLAALQFRFVEGGVRDYLLLWKSIVANATGVQDAGGCREPRTDAGETGAGGLDLRRADDTAALEKELLALDLDAMA